MVELQPSKLAVRVRFPSPALTAVPPDALAFREMLWIGFAIFIFVVLAAIIWAWKRSGSESDWRG